MQALMNFGKHIFKEFTEADGELLAGSYSEQPLEMRVTWNTV